MKRIIPFILISMMTISCTKQQTTGIDLANLDTTAVAQNDFYQYACGGWMAANPIPDEYSRYGQFDALRLRALEQVNNLIAEVSKTKHPHGTMEQKIADVYNLTLDTVRRNQEGIAPVQKTIEEIDRISSRDELSTVLGKALDYGMFAMYVEADGADASMNVLWEAQAGFALGEKSYYLEDTERSKEVRAEYLKHVAKMFSLFQYENGEEMAQTVMRLETRMAKAALYPEEMRDPVANYNKMSVDELQKLVPEIDWKAFFDAMEIDPGVVAVGQVRHLQEVGKMLAEEPLEDLKTLFIWQVIDGAASYLTDEIYMQNFNFYSKFLSGAQEPTPLWKRGVGMVNGILGEGVGQIYVKKYFSAAAKERMYNLVLTLQVALGQRINEAEWMSDSTKAKALEKLAAYTIKIGYPDKWRDYSALDIDPSLTLYENLQRAARFEMDYSLSYLNKPVDKDKWYMTPQTVNAYYNPSSNEICFPAAILQPPFFDMEADDAANYGAIGVVIGHEMTHGFDDQGSMFDKQGNLNNWWTAEDRARFEERTEVMKKHFDKIEVAPGLMANGTLTLGENIADNGGLQISYRAFCNNEEAKKTPLGERDGFTPVQRFFLAYANVWAGNIRPEEMVNLTKTDPHSLGRWRTNGALPHIDAWYEAFGVTEESPLYVAPENRAHIW